MKIPDKYRLKAISLFSKEYSQDVRIKVKISLFYCLFSILVFSCFRFLFYFSYPEIFGRLPLNDVIFAFAYGLRFDISVISVFSALWIFILFLPVKSEKIVKFAVLMLCCNIVIMTLLLLGDYFYFPEVKRHMTEDILLALTEKGFILDYIVRIYWKLLVIVFFAAAACVGLLFRFINKGYRPKPVGLMKNIILIIPVVCLILLSARGKFTGRPLNVEDVYKTAKGTSQATLIMNGIFSQYQALKKSAGIFSNNYPKEEAFVNARALLFDGDEEIVDEQYPLMRKIVKKGDLKKYNIIVVLLESWTPKYIDSVSAAGYGVTPNFDKIARDGVFFSNAYSSGSRSIYGICGALLGMPVMPGMPLLGYGLEVNVNASSMFETFNAMGYFTMYVQSSSRKSLKMCDISKNIFHARESFGKEDIPQIWRYNEDIYSGYDYEMLDFVSKKAAAAREAGTPFFIFSFTGTTHSPFIQTTPQFRKYSADTDEGKYLNNLYYCDYAIGALIENAKTAGYFDDTVFVFMADHILTSVQKDDNVIEKFKIPFVIYAPKILGKRKIDYVVSQADLMPTIYHLLNIGEPFSSSGKNALNPGGRHFALINDGNNIVFIDDSGYMRHNRIKALESSFDSGSGEFSDMEEKIMFLDKAVTETVKYNKWFKPDGLSR